MVVSETPVVEAAAPSRPRDAAPVPTAETTAPVTPPRPPPAPEEATPTTADLLALAATTNPLDESNGERCAACGDDAYSLRSQLVPCTSCGRAFHAGCVRLRAIPFRGSTRADRRYRELFVKRYFGDWMCKECERRPAVVCAPKSRRRPAARPAPRWRRAWRSWRRRGPLAPRRAARGPKRDIPVRRAREGERGPPRAVGRGRARACALPGEGGLAIGSVRCRRDRRREGVSRLAGLSHRSPDPWASSDRTLRGGSVRIDKCLALVRHGPRRHRRPRSTTVLLRHLRRLRRVEGPRQRDRSCSDLRV